MIHILRFIFKILRSVIIGLIMMTGLFFLAASFLSKKFPPDMELAKEHVNNLFYAKEHYSTLINKSGNYLNNELGSNDSSNISEMPNTASTEIKEIDLQIKKIKSQLNRIEEQNNIILKNLKK